VKLKRVQMYENVQHVWLCLRLLDPPGLADWDTCNLHLADP